MSSGREVESDNTVTSSRNFFFQDTHFPAVFFWPPIAFAALFRCLPTPPCSVLVILRANPVSPPLPSLSLFIIIRSFRSIGASLEFHSGLTGQQLFQLTPLKRNEHGLDSIPAIFDYACDVLLYKIPIRSAYKHAAFSHVIK